MQHIGAIIENLKLCDFDMIILDTGPNIFDYTIMSLMKSDLILAISTCEVASAKRLDGVIADILSRMPEYNPEKVKLIINKYDPNLNISPQELIDVLNLELYGVIPNYPEICNMNNSGYSAFYNKARNKEEGGAYISSIIEIAKKVSGIDKLQQRNGNGMPQQPPMQNQQRYNAQPPQGSVSQPSQQQFINMPQPPAPPKKKKGFLKSFFGGKE
jgi:septum formation inhibitor-activating ATPase MinD